MQEDGKERRMGKMKFYVNLLNVEKLYNEISLKNYWMTESTQTIYYKLIRCTLERSTSKFNCTKKTMSQYMKKKTIRWGRKQAESQI